MDKTHVYMFLDEGGMALVRVKFVACSSVQDNNPGQVSNQVL